MPERPLILFSKPRKAEREKRHSFPTKYHTPSYEKQIERLQPQFNILQEALENGRVAFSKTADGIEPEYTLVLEVLGDPAEFEKTVRRLQTEYPDIDYIFETAKEDMPGDEDFYAMTKNGMRDDNKLMVYKYFCILTNLQALDNILSLWNSYRVNKSHIFPEGKTGLKNVFDKLKDIHLWGAKERFEETGVRESWEEDLANPDLLYLRCEIELFFRHSEKKRIYAEQKLRLEIEHKGGEVLAQSCIEEIGYHTILVSIPRQYAKTMLQRQDISFIAFNEIMFIKPQGQIIITNTLDSFDYGKAIPQPKNISADPILALFDGLPQENHPLLKNYLIIDDPDDYTSSYQIADRLHGTAMASLIIHSDLNDSSAPISRKIYVRPIMKPRQILPDTIHEYIPDNVLLVDQVHRAVRRLFDPIAGRVAPTIRVINLSIGIHVRLYYDIISPLAKLLDWLSLKYHVLFIVSAGNHAENINLGIPFADFARLSGADKDEIVIRFIDANKRNQKLLSPAESMNSLTAGAMFADHSKFTPNERQILPCSSSIPSPISALGRGINHAIKPDLLMNGGMGAVSPDLTNPAIARWRTGTNIQPPGILNARPVIAAGGVSKAGYTFGTSNAAAILSHNALHCYDVLNDIFMAEMAQGIPVDYTAILLKAMLVHGSEWGETGAAISQALNYKHRNELSDKLHKWLGYGKPDIERVKECTKNRITLIGYDELNKEAAHEYSLPLPFDFHAQKLYRRLTVTLAYFTPIALGIKKYRKAHLWFTLNDNGRKLLKTRLDANDKAATRGTLQHEIFYDQSAIVWGEDDGLTIKVNCREDAIGLNESIRYALFVTFEIASQHNIDVYARVAQKIKPMEMIRSS
jgi:hypothetical protein